MSPSTRIHGYTFVSNIYTGLGLKVEEECCLQESQRSKHKNFAQEIWTNRSAVHQYLYFPVRLVQSSNVLLHNHLATNKPQTHAVVINILQRF